MSEINRNNQYKMHIFIVIIILFISWSASAQMKSEATTNSFRKYVYLYELPNTSPKQVRLKVQSDSTRSYTWHSLLLTKRGDYQYQLFPDSEQQFSAFAQAMLDVKVEYNKVPANRESENRIFCLQEAINAPKSFGPKVWGPLTMGYFVERFQQATFSTLLVDNIALELVNITKILESKAQNSNNRKLLASFGFEKANATVADLEQMRQDKTLIKGEPAFQDAYFQQIQSWQPTAKATKQTITGASEPDPEPNSDMAANSIKIILMIVSFSIAVIILGFVGWFILYKILSAIKQVIQILSELRGELGTGVMEIITAQSEKISELEENVVKKLRDIDETAKTMVEHLVTLQQKIGEYHRQARPNGAIHDGITPQGSDVPVILNRQDIKELDINIEGEIRRGRDDNAIFVSFSNPNQFSVSVTDIGIDFTDLKTELPLVIPPQDELRVEAKLDASKVKEKKVEVFCHVSYEGQGIKQEKRIPIEIETIPVTLSDAVPTFHPLQITLKESEILEDQRNSLVLTIQNKNVDRVRLVELDSLFDEMVFSDDAQRQERRKVYDIELDIGENSIPLVLELGIQPEFEEQNLDLIHKKLVVSGLCEWQGQEKKIESKTVEFVIRKNPQVTIRKMDGVLKELL